jgi:hypothetical protein
VRQRGRRCECFSSHTSKTAKCTQDTRTPLHWAASVGALDVARYLLDHGAPVDAPDGSGWTPLHIAGENASLRTNHARVAERGSQRGTGGRCKGAGRRRRGREAHKRQGTHTAVRLSACRGSSTADGG